MGAFATRLGNAQEGKLAHLTTLAMYTLGISCFFHDSAVALLRDGELIFAAEEERFSRVKHDNRFPKHALEACFKEVGITAADLHEVCFYEKPLRKFERVLEDFTRTYPRSFLAFVRTMPEWLSERLDIEKSLEALGYTGVVQYVPHHLSHAAAAFYSSPFPNAAVVVVDGVGEYETTSLWHATDNGLIQKAALNYPHSLGLLYSTITAFLGFRVNDEEYKVMALAALPTDVTVNLSPLVEQREDGSFALVMKYFSFRAGGRMWSGKLEELLGEPRMPGSTLTPRHIAIAYALQQMTEDVMTALVKRAHHEIPSAHLCLAGGVALNAVANGVLAQGPFSALHVFGAAGDSGAAYGAAAYVYHQSSAPVRVRTSPLNLCIGTSHDHEVDAVAQASGIPYQKLIPSEVAPRVAALLAEGKVIARVSGKMEFGPRALGNRSLLAHPGHPEAFKKLHTIKSRESFRPFGGMFLHDQLHAYVQLPHGVREYPYMNVCLPAINEARIPNIVHVDGSCRVQTVHRNHGDVSDILVAFEKSTGIAALLNTSFNRRGEPLVENLEQALAVFKEQPIDYLLVGDTLFYKDTL